MLARRLVLFFALVAAPVAARAELPVGRQLPMFEATDLNDAHRTAQELVGRPTVVVVTPSRGASDQAKLWADHAEKRYGARVHVVSLVAIDLPLIPSSVARGAARDRTARQYWSDTWMADAGPTRRALGIDGDRSEPYVFSLDWRGRITAGVHGAYSDENARPIWQALGE